ARYSRRGMHYTAYLVTLCIVSAHALFDCPLGPTPAGALVSRCRATIARILSRWFWHAALYAHNIMVTPEDILLICLDRRELRQTARAWREGNLARLRRSLLKLGAADHGDTVFEKRIWAPLMQGYERAMEQKA